MTYSSRPCYFCKRQQEFVCTCEFVSRADSKPTQVVSSGGWEEQSLAKWFALSLEAGPASCAIFISLSLMWNHEWSGAVASSLNDGSTHIVPMGSRQVGRQQVWSWLMMRDYRFQSCGYILPRAAIKKMEESQKRWYQTVNARNSRINHRKCELTDKPALHLTIWSLKQFKRKQKQIQRCS